jgi:hypothetical protein
VPPPTSLIPQTVPNDLGLRPPTVFGIASLITGVADVARLRWIDRLDGLIREYRVVA